MDEDLSIINTNTRNEKIKNFFVNNKNKIISGIIILIIIIVGVFSYDKYLINKKKDISDSYNSIIFISNHEINHCIWIEFSITGYFKFASQNWSG